MWGIGGQREELGWSRALFHQILKSMLVKKLSAISSLFRLNRCHRLEKSKVSLPPMVVLSDAVVAVLVLTHSAELLALRLGSKSVFFKLWVGTQ